VSQGRRRHRIEAASLQGNHTNGATGEIDIVIVRRFDRLARNLDEASRAAKRLQKLGVATRGVVEPVADITTPEGLLVFQIMGGGIAEYERAAIKSRTQAGRVKAAEDGKHAGAKYRSDTAGRSTGLPLSMTKRRRCVVSTNYTPPG